MGFSFRKSFKAGPIRVNVSKSGIGTSIGTKGARIGVNAKGKTYVSGGVGPIRYRSNLNSKQSSNSILWLLTLPFKLLLLPIKMIFSILSFIFKIPRLIIVSPISRWLLTIFIFFGSFGAILENEIISAIILIGLGYLIIPKRKKGKKFIHKQSKFSNEDDSESSYLPGKFYEEAEELRKAGRVVEAEAKYLAAIEVGEESTDWKQFEPPPAMYRELAKLYYHTNRDEKAVEILDRYLDNRSNQTNNNEMVILREKILNGSLRRLVNKYK